MKKILKWILISVVFVIYSLGIFFGGWAVGLDVAQKPYPSEVAFTGQEIFDAVNQKRMDTGIQSLSLNSIACEGIVQRLFDLRKGENDTAHPGFDAFARKIYEVSDAVAVGEVYVSDVSSVDQVIDAWTQSPSHRLVIENQKFNAGCAYADGFDAVVIFLELQ